MSRNLENRAKQVEPEWVLLRDEMLENQIIARGVLERSVIEAMRRVPRHEFIPEERRAEAYADCAVYLGYGQTVSQPYIVALMTELARPTAKDKALDVGTGSGYQAAVLAEMVAHVDSVEIIEPLASEAAARLKRLGYRNVRVHHGDASKGWANAPYDLIVVAAAPEHVPEALVAQLANGGRLVIPIGGQGEAQGLWLFEKGRDGEVSRRLVTGVCFVPMTGAVTKGG
jgi:protein-L-isoaspartate(D-aspartate) O-methyltransferase